MANPLQTVARLYNIQTRYRDGFGQLRTAPTDSVLSVLNSLGAPVRSLEDLPNSLRERRQSQWQRGIEPVTVAWQNQPLKIKLRLPSRLAQEAVAAEIILENGERLEGRCEDVRAIAPVFKEVEGAGYVVRFLRWQTPIPLGYHRLHLRVGSLHLQSMLISAPLEAYAPPQTDDKRWGVFCPLYALRSARNWGAGDFTDLATFAGFIGELRGQAVATLPTTLKFPGGTVQSESLCPGEPAFLE